MQIITVAVALGTFAVGANANPLGKAITMLEELRDEITVDGAKEDKQFKDFSMWCHKGNRDFKHQIKTDKNEREDETATIDKAKSDKSSASSKIEDLAGEESSTEGELKAASAIRAKEHSQFVGTEKELLESIDTLERAGNVLQRKMRGAALVQTTVNAKSIKDLISTLNEVVNAASLSLHDENTLMSLAQTSEQEDDEDLGEFGNHAGKKKNSVLDMLEDLKQKAEKQLYELRKEETNARQNFEMAKGSLTDQMKLMNKEIKQGKARKSAASQTKAVTEGDLSMTLKDLKIDKTGKGNLDRSCIDKAADYDASVKARAGELTAVKTALKFLKNVISGNHKASFLEIQNPDNRFAVVNLLRRLAFRQQNSAFTQLAGRVSAVMTQASRRHEADPFKKVRGMINGMVKRLSKEASAEASQKDYCDKETKETADKKEELGYALDKQNAELDKKKAKSAFLRDQVSTLQKDLAELSESQTEADAIRREEKGTFDVSMKDLSMGLQGVRSALNALHQQYDQPDTHVKEFHHAKSEHSTTGMEGIFSLLEVVEEDLTKKIANIDAEEKNALKLYKKLTQDNKDATLTKQLSVKYKRKEFKALNKNLAEENSDLDALSNEMDAVLDYSKNLRKQCEVKPETYADKKAKRDAEIEGLKSALKTLEEEVSLLQIDVPRHSSLRGVVAVPH